MRLLAILLLLLAWLPAGAEPRQEGRSEIEQAFTSGNYFAVDSLCGAAGNLTDLQLYAVFASSVMSGVTDRRPEAEALVKIGEATGNPGLIAAVDLLWTEYGFRWARPDLIELHLPRAELGLSQLPGASKYVAESYRCARDFQRDPSMPWESMLSDWDRSLAQLEKAGPAQLRSLGAGRLFWLATSRRVAAMMRRGAPVEKVQAVLERAGKLGEADNLEFALGSLDLQIQLSQDQWERDGDRGGVDRRLGRLQADLGKLRQQLETRDRDYARPVAKFSMLDADFSRLEGKILLLVYRSHYGSVLGQLDQAGFRQGLEVFTKASQAAHRSIMCQGALEFDGLVYDSLGILLWQGEMDKARRLLELQLGQCRQFGSRLGLAQALWQQAALDLTQGREDDALRSLQECVALVEEVVEETGGSLQGQQQLRDRFRRAYKQLARLQLSKGQTATAFNTLARWQHLESMAASPPSRQPDLVALRLKGESLQTLAAAQQRQIEVKQAAPALQKRLSEERSRFYTELSRLRRDHPEYEGKLAVRPVNYSKIQPTLPPGTAVVQYLPLADRLVIFVASRDRLWTTAVNVTERQLNEQVVTMLRQMGPRSGWDPAASEKLFGWLVAPVLKEMTAPAHLAFVPTGYLHYLPFGALSYRVDATSHYLCETTPSSVIGKSSDLEQLSHGVQASDQGLLALGNPDGSLPAAEQECLELQQLMPGSEAFLRDKAVRGVLGQKPCSFLHLATHGRVDNQDPEASYILLAGQGRAARLTLSDVYELNLKGTRMVCLSACRTGLAEREPKSELTSLAEAFSIAGSSSVVASLWSVQDESTRLLMVELYRQLKAEKPLATALQQAQLSLLRQPKYAHPMHWAPFLVLGDWR